MTAEFDWAPYILVIEVFLAFIGICFLAALSDLWAKGSRKPPRPNRPFAMRNGERIYLN